MTVDWDRAAGRSWGYAMTVDWDKRRGTRVVERALELALFVHGGQVDNAGQPYLLHVMRVMHQMHSEDARAVALLHDSLEDSGRDAQEVRYRIERDFLPGIGICIETLTRRPSEDYLSEYIARVNGVVLPRKVKIADLHDNLDPRRGLDHSDVAWLRIQKYHRALEILNG